MRQRAGEDVPLPICVKLAAKMLRRAAAAIAKIWTDRRDALWARLKDFQELAALALNPRDHAFAGQGARDIDRAACGAHKPLAAMAEAVDQQFQCERIIHDARQTETLWRRRRRELAKE